MAAHHQLLNGKLHLYKRENSSYWQCSAFLQGRNFRVSTREDSLSRAKDVAEDWYLELRGKGRRGEIDVAGAKKGKSFREAAAQFEEEFAVITEGERNPKYVTTTFDRIRVHLIPFFGDTALADITPGMVQQYRVHRATSRVHKKTGEPQRPARSTLHHEIIALRHVLKTAHRHGWLPMLPDISAPYRASGKISHRAWFSPGEYKQLYEATRERAANPKNPRWKRESEQFHDYVLFMANTGLRPDEASGLQYRDVEIVRDEDSGETILEIEVRGKRGVGYCKSMAGAVTPFRRLLKRNTPSPTDLVFGKVQRELLNTVLGELGLKQDRDGNPRTAYSLRHTYICMRLMEGADIYQIAKNCRTSVEMIEKFYAAHIKNTLDARAINVRRERRKPPAPERVRRVDKVSQAKTAD